MPELPETETIARDLSELVVGATVAAARAPRPDVLRHMTSAQFARSMRGLRIARVWRRAKNVVLDLTPEHHLVVQLRFTGSLTVHDRDAATRVPYLCVWIELEDGRALVYSDVRRLGTVALLSSKHFDAWSCRLGEEPLDPAFTEERLSGLLRGCRSAVKRALMDQRLVAGIGNIYANESLFRAMIDPSRRSLSLTMGEVASLHHSIQAVLTEAIAARGTSFRDYRDGRGERGNYSEQLQAYGRGGRPCGRCGSRLAETHAIDGRSTVFCFRCQC